MAEIIDNDADDIGHDDDETSKLDSTNGLKDADEAKNSDDQNMNQEENGGTAGNLMANIFDDEADGNDNHEEETSKLNSTNGSKDADEAKKSEDEDANQEENEGTAGNLMANIFDDEADGNDNHEEETSKLDSTNGSKDADEAKNSDDQNMNQEENGGTAGNLMANIFDDEADGSDNDEDETSKLDSRNESKDADGDKKSEDEDANQEEDGGTMGNLMANIFGDDNDVDDDDDDNKEGDSKQIASDEDEPKFLRVENGSDDNDGREWDFDVMLRKKKAAKKKRKTKGDSISLISDADDQVKALVDAMSEAANIDRQSNIDKRPAIQKRKMLPLVRQTLLKSDLFETLLDNGMMSAISEWLAPLPDKSLPALEVRTTLLKILQSYPGLEQGILKQSGLGKAVMFLFKHPKEIRENKTIAAKLIREWSRPIFQLDTDFRSLSREERWQRDYQQLPPHKRQRLNLDEDGNPITQNQPSSSQSDADSQNAESGLRPGEAGFIMRARVPRPSTKSYVVRPKPGVEGRFQGPSKNRTTDRFDKAQREFKDRNRSQKTMIADEQADKYYVSAATRLKLILLGGVVSFSSIFQMGASNAYVNTATDSFYHFLNVSLEAKGYEMTESLYLWVWSITLNSWFPGFALGSIIAIPITDNCGRKTGLLFGNILTFIATMLMTLGVFFEIIELFFTGRLLSAISSAISMCALILLLQEIAPLDLRGKLSFFAELSFVVTNTVGMIMGMTSVFGNYLTILIGVAIIPSVLSILIVFPLYETPKYLLVKSKDRKSATESIKFYLQIADSATSYFLKDVEEVCDDSNRHSFIDGMKLPHVRWGLFLGLLALQITTSIWTVVFYSTDFMRRSNISHFLAEYISSFMLIISVISTFCGFFTIENCKRKSVFIISSAINIFSLVIFTLFSELQRVDDLFKYGCAFALCLHSVSYSFALGPIAWFITAELVPTEYRSTCQSMALAINQIIAFFLTIMVLPLYDMIGPYSLIVLFVLPSTVAIIVLCWRLPETKGRDIQQIIDDLGRAIIPRVESYKIN